MSLFGRYLEDFTRLGKEEGSTVQAVAVPPSVS